MFTKTAEFYNRIYGFKDYRQEAGDISRIVHERLAGTGHRLLDVACGTGKHIEHLKASFSVEGLDISEELLEVARQANPKVPLHLGDMTDFILGRQFDVVTCLFSSIGYVGTVPRLGKAIERMSAHIRPGGLLIVEPWFTPEAWNANTVHASFIDDPELKVARVSTSFVEGTLSFFDLHYLIGTPTGTQHYVERHELGLFTVVEIRAAFGESGMAVDYDPVGLTGRGLYVARKPAGD